MVLSTIDYIMLTPLTLFALHIAGIFPVLGIFFVFGSDVTDKIDKWPVFKHFAPEGKYSEYTQVFYFPIIAFLGFMLFFGAYLLGTLARHTSMHFALTLVAIFAIPLLVKGFKTQRRELRELKSQISLS